MLRKTLLPVLFLLLTSIALQAQKRQPVSQSFELRYVTSDPAADGETDFKGATAWFDTPRRVEYLQKYAAYASRWFDDRTLAEQVVPDEEVERAMAARGSSYWMSRSMAKRP